MPGPVSLVDYYAQVVEVGRLSRREGVIEAARTKELLSRYIGPPSVILDVGGGPGFYAEWLAGQGHQVLLVDPVPLHVEEARRLAGDPARFEAELGDARKLASASGEFDAVLMMGPLYHLVDEADRVTALKEASRVCRSGGYILATAISRFAPALDGVRQGWIANGDSFAILEEQLETGRGLLGSPSGTASAAYFHSAEQLAKEAAMADLEVVDVLGIEGAGWLIPDFEAKWDDPVMRERLMWLARKTENDPRMLSASANLLLVARHTDAGDV